MTEEKARPPRHTGEDDVAFDHRMRDKAPGGSARSGKDPETAPRTDTTGPGDTGTVPSDTHVAMPKDYDDPWDKRPPLEQAHDRPDPDRDNSKA